MTMVTDVLTARRQQSMIWSLRQPRTSRPDSVRCTVRVYWSSAAPPNRWTVHGRSSAGWASSGVPVRIAKTESACGRTHKYHALRLPFLPLMILQLAGGPSNSLGPLWRPHTSITRSEAALSTLGPACATACAPMNTSDFVASYWSHKVSWKVICLQG